MSARSPRYRLCRWIAASIILGSIAGTIAWMIFDYHKIVYGVTITVFGIFALLGITLESDDEGPTWRTK